MQCTYAISVHTQYTAGTTRTTARPKQIRSQLKSTIPGPPVLFAWNVKKAVWRGVRGYFPPPLPRRWALVPHQQTPRVIRATKTASSTEAIHFTLDSGLTNKGTVDLTSLRTPWICSWQRTARLVFSYAKALRLLHSHGSKLNATRGVFRHSRVAARQHGARVQRRH